ncbi:MAG: UvrD-helicase domain-containing protein [Clostridia bacterium]
MKFIVDTTKTVLSSKTKIFKTEKFIGETKVFGDIDFFVSKLGETIILNSAKIASAINVANALTTSFKIEIGNTEHIFFFKLGNQLEPDYEVNPNDIVFFRYIDNKNVRLINDQRLINLCRENTKFNIEIVPINDIINKSSFYKLYRISNANLVNFPQLTSSQEELVTTEDQNVLVQGVAGSGKTNICIEKIIYTACREYTGRVLYSTFSRGLLIDTQNKVEVIINNLMDFVNSYRHNSVIFIEENHKKAIENKLGLYFSEDSEQDICVKIEKIVKFLQDKVDYFLLEDIYRKFLSNNSKEIMADERYFIKTYLGNIRDYQLNSKLTKIKYLSYEVIYKEIYGLIEGVYNIQKPNSIMTVNDYVALRKDSFTRYECEIIFAIFIDYQKYLEKNELIDNNIISTKMLNNLDKLPHYSLSILDEVQDMTQINLCLMRKITIKMFCVGDALQMINPSYFSFAYLKNLLYTKDVVNVAKLSNNYRNTAKISQIIDNLSAVNTSKFGVHNFVVAGKSVDSDIDTETIYVKNKTLINEIAKQKYDSITVVVSSQKSKEELRKILPSQEILTISEIKGLERDIVVLYEIIGDNLDKWKALERTLINRKQAKENSVFRYYFNLFYVGISRAKAHLYVVEHNEVGLLKDFFDNNFDNLDVKCAIDKLNKVASKILVDQNELANRVGQFISLGQFDNAGFSANKIVDDIEKTALFNRIQVNEDFVSKGQYKQAGIAFWELGMFDDANTQFLLSGDKILIDLMGACKTGQSDLLDIDIIKFLPEVSDNKIAVELILQTLNKDLVKTKETQKNLNNRFRKMKEQ